MNAKQLIRDAERCLMTECHKELPQASAWELHNALSGAAMDALAPLWAKKEAVRFPRRQAAYLSMEFLVGRLIYNNLYCMGLLDEAKALLKEKGVDIAVTFNADVEGSYSASLLLASEGANSIAISNRHQPQASLSIDATTGTCRLLEM